MYDGVIKPFTEFVEHVAHHENGLMHYLRMRMLVEMEDSSLMETYVWHRLDHKVLRSFNLSAKDPRCLIAGANQIARDLGLTNALALGDLFHATVHSGKMKMANAAVQAYRVEEKKGNMEVVSDMKQVSAGIAALEQVRQSALLDLDDEDKELNKRMMLSSMYASDSEEETDMVSVGYSDSDASDFAFQVCNPNMGGKRAAREVAIQRSLAKGQAYDASGRLRPGWARHAKSGHVYCKQPSLSESETSTTTF